MLRLIKRTICPFGQFIKLTRLEGHLNKVAKLQLVNPKKKNALEVALLDELDATCKEINKQYDLRAIILRSSEEGYFCSGADLKERLTKTSDQIETLVFNLRRIFNDVRHIHCPVVCIIDGAALGGGLELALNADIRICTKKSLIGLPQTHWSLLPGGGGTQTLARAIGMAKAKQLIFTSRKLNGQQALQYGIVNYCEQNFQAAEKRAISLIEEMLPNGPLGIKHAKRAINWGSDVDLRTGLEIERINYERIVRSEDRVEGFKAFAEKRNPVYQGK